MNFFNNPYYYSYEPMRYGNPYEVQYYMNPMYLWNPYDIYSNYWLQQMNPNNDSSTFRRPKPIGDQGPKPFAINIEDATKENMAYRRALWTGPHLQVTLMSLQPGEDIGLEIHPDTDQFLRIEQGEGIVEMGRNRNNLDYRRRVNEDFAIMVPAGTWHNVTNIGDGPLKLYSIYAPPHHPQGTVHRTKTDALAQENIRYSMP